MAAFEAFLVLVAATDIEQDKIKCKGLTCLHIYPQQRAMFGPLPAKSRRLHNRADLPFGAHLMGIIVK